MAIRFDTDTSTSFRGSVDMANASSVSYKALAIADGAVSATANITWSKVQSHFTETTNFGIEADAVAAAKTVVMWEARAAGVLDFCYAGLMVDGSANINFMLKIDTTDALTGNINVLSSTGDHTAVAGTLVGGSVVFAAGAVFVADLAVTTATSTQGPYLTFGAHYTATPS